MKSPAKEIGRPWLLILGVPCAVFLAVWAFGLFQEPESPSVVAENAERAIVDSDAAAIFSYLSSDEITALKLDEDVVERYLVNFVGPRMAGFKPVGIPDVSTMAFDGTATRAQLFQHPDGRAFRLTTQASPAGRENARINAFIANTYLCLTNTTLKPGETPPVGPNKRTKWLEDAESIGPELRQLGISGFYTAGHKTFTWESWAAHNRRALAGVR